MITGRLAAHLAALLMVGATGCAKGPAPLPTPIKAAPPSEIRFAPILPGVLGWEGNLTPIEAAAQAAPQRTVLISLTPGEMLPKEISKSPLELGLQALQVRGADPGKLALSGTPTGGEKLLVAPLNEEAGIAVFYLVNRPESTWAQLQLVAR